MDVLGLIRFSALGDIQLSEAVPRLLKARHPETRIVYITKRVFAELPAGWPDVDEVICLEKDESIASLRGRIREAGVTSLVDLHSNLRSRLLAPFAARLPKHRLDKLLLQYAPRFLSRRTDPGPVYLRYLKLLDLDTCDPDRIRPRLVIEGDHLCYGEASHIVLVPGAGRASKTWPRELWLEFTRLLLQNVSQDLLILGGAKEEELGAELAERSPDRITNLCGSLSISESARKLASASCVVCGDTGLMHMADAAGVPGVVLAGSSHARLGFYPSGDTLAVLEQELDCRPCSHVGRDRCPKGHFDCVRNLSPESVLATLRESCGELFGELQT